MNSIDPSTETPAQCTEVSDKRIEPNELLTYEEAATYLKITVKTLKALVRRKAIVYVPVTRTEIRFKKQQLDHWTDHVTVWPKGTPSCQSTESTSTDGSATSGKPYAAASQTANRSVSHSERTQTTQPRPSTRPGNGNSNKSQDGGNVTFLERVQKA